MDVQTLEYKLSAARLSYNRQLSLCANARYDPELTFDLKTDIEWLEQQIALLEKVNTVITGGKKSHQ